MNRRDFLKTVGLLAAVVLPAVTPDNSKATVEDVVIYHDAGLLKNHEPVEDEYTSIDDGPFVCKNSVTRSAAMNKCLGVIFHVDGQDDIIIPQAHITSNPGYSNRFYGKRFFVGQSITIETSMILCGEKSAGNALSRMMSKEILVTLPLTKPALYRINRFEMLYVENNTEYTIEICPI